jgi:hypothetical protein
LALTQQRRDGLISILVISTVVIISGIAGLFYSVNKAPSPSDRFNQMMITHHSQAISMALIMVRRAENTELQSISQDIVLTQQSQVGSMIARLESANAGLVGENHKMPGMVKSSEIATLQTLPIRAAELKMIKLMIAHHQGGVEMAFQSLQSKLDAPTRRLAQSIIIGQRSEILELEKLAEIIAKK